MNTDVNKYIAELCKRCDRIVITTERPLNVKNKKVNSVLADIRDANEIEFVGFCLQMDMESFNGSWMSPVEVYINFLQSKSLIKSVGVVLQGLLRSEEWNRDYELINYQEFHEWLLKNGATYTPR